MNGFCVLTTEVVPKIFTNLNVVHLFVLARFLLADAGSFCVLMKYQPLKRLKKIDVFNIICRFSFSTAMQ